MKSINEAGYNEMLFSGGLRRWLHLARFRWFIRELNNLRCPYKSVLELGCFDGKLIEFFPEAPMHYKGFNANWEGGLDKAHAKYVSSTNYSFFKACTPEDMHFGDDERFDIAVVMETLEHVPPNMIGGYLEKIASRLDGYLFITVPNEKGMVFFAKWLMKRILTKDVEEYSKKELLNAFFGRMHLVKRREHKGFDYASLVVQVAEYFDIRKVSGFPFRFLPTSLAFGVGIVAKSRR